MLSRKLLLFAALTLGCTTPPPGAEPAPALHRRWSARIGQGPEPKGDEAFRLLAARGYTLVLSVDGALTEVEAARRHGLRYAHVPIGYEGIERDQALAIVKAVRSAKGAVYVHCHHGRHRGPSAAALARIALGEATKAQALRGLLQTLSPAYPGLRRAVAAFVAPTPAELEGVPQPASRVRPTDLVAHMLEIGERWEWLKARHARGWEPDPSAPDLSPEHQARLLVEGFREAARLPESKRFTAPLVQAEAAAQTLEAALKAKAPTGAAIAALKQSCLDCHRAHRN